MPFERTGEIDRTPAYMKRQKSKMNTVGYLVEGAGICNGFYCLKGKAYEKQGSDGKTQMKKMRKGWQIRIQDEDNEWETYFSNQQPKPKPPPSGWRNAFDNKPDDDIKVSRTLLKNLTEEEVENIMSGGDTDKAVKLDDIDARPPETPAQKKARERMEKRKAKMEARRKGGNKGKKGGKKGGKKQKSEESTKNEDENSAKERASTPPPTQEVGGGTLETPEKKSRSVEEEEENVEAADDILTVLFQTLKPRYAKYRESFEEFGVSDLEMLKEVDNDALTELGVGSGLERKVMLKTIQQVCSRPQGSSGPSEPPASQEDVKNHKQLKMKAKQLQNKIRALETKKSKLEKAISKLQKTKMELENQ